jgi:hypothetical protein
MEVAKILVKCDPNDAERIMEAIKRQSGVQTVHFVQDGYLSRIFDMKKTFASIHQAVRKYNDSLGDMYNTDGIKPWMAETLKYVVGEFCKAYDMQEDNSKNQYGKWDCVLNGAGKVVFDRKVPGKATISSKAALFRGSYKDTRTADKHFARWEKSGLIRAVEEKSNKNRTGEYKITLEICGDILVRK